MRRVSWVLLALSMHAPALRAEEVSDTKSKVDEIFKEYDRSDSPGCVLGVFHDGRIEYARGYGMANLELGVALTPQSVLDLGSTAKQFAAFSIHLLARDGKLSLDDDIRKWVPEIPSYGKPIAVRHLLHHTGGLRDYLELFEFAGVRDEDLTTADDALAMLGRQKAANFAPGEEHVYSNSGYFLLSVIVKRASGKSLRDFAAERIFGPLGMTHTQYNDDHARIIRNRATGYRKKNEGFEIAMSDFEQTGDGGVLTSVEDLQRWDENFYDPKVGDRALFDAMLVPGTLNNGKKIRYGSGLYASTYRGLPTVLHGGAWVGYRAQLMRFPDQHLTVACLCNLGQADPSALARRVSVVYLGHLMKPEEPVAVEGNGSKASAYAASAEELAARLGTYQSRDTVRVLRLATQDGRVVADRAGERLLLRPVAPGRFVVEGGDRITIDFDTAARGRAAARVTSGEGDDRETEIFDPVDAAGPRPSDLPQFAGTYASAELETTWRIVLDGGKLFLKYRNAPTDPLSPTIKDSFSVGYQTLAFSRDSSGRVSGFKLGAGRVRGVVFKRVPA